MTTAASQCNNKLLPANLCSLGAKKRAGVDASRHPLILHMLDVAAVAEAVLMREPAVTRESIAAALGLKWAEARPWVLLAVSCHDIGKACPGFQTKDGRAAIPGLRANPSVTRNSKRLGLLSTPEQEQWLERKGREQHGFALPVLAFPASPKEQVRRISVRITQERMLHGRRRNGAGIRVFSVLYDGILSVTEPDKFLAALEKGIGHGKTMGLGLLSIAPIL